MVKPTRKVFIAMSGGVDSSLAAALLKEQGYTVHGVYMKNWSSTDPLHCPWQEEVDTASAVAKHLDISFESWHLEEEYRRDVVEYMVAEYKAGRTPNPDVLCNEKIKFGIFLKKARAAGADMIATGHYVRLMDHKLFRAIDHNKDQSYFLCRLTQEQLQYCLFPLGELTKPQVREEAHKRGLPNWGRKDSQGLCFVGKVDMGKFLQDFIKPQKGVAKLPDGTVVGEHQGAWYFTRGQRHGFSRGGTEKLYVADRDLQANTLTVAPEGHPLLYATRIMVTNVHWISGIAPVFPFECQGVIRYRQVPVSCRVEIPSPLPSPARGEGVTPSPRLSLEGRGPAEPSRSMYSLRQGEGVHYVVTFIDPQFASAPGQFLVLYNGEEMLGSGIIIFPLPPCLAARDLS